MYAFMHVDYEKMSVEDHFTATEMFVDNYKKMSTTGPVPKHWLGFSYISSEDNELDQIFDDTELEKPDHNIFAK